MSNLKKNTDLTDTINVEKMNVKEIEEASKKIGDQLALILLKATKEANAVIEGFGLEARISYSLNKKQKEG